VTAGAFKAFKPCITLDLVLALWDLGFLSTEVLDLFVEKGMRVGGLPFPMAVSLKNTLKDAGPKDSTKYVYLLRSLGYLKIFHK